jgi:integrase
MPDESSHGARSRERVAPNVWRRLTRGGETVFEVKFRDVDGRSRRLTLDATTDRAAIREARKVLAGRDAGERQVADDVTVRGFAEAEWLPLIASLAAAGRRSEQGVRLDRDAWRLYVEPALGDLRLGAVSGTDVAAMLRALRSRSLSEATCKNTLGVLGAIYRLARARRAVTRSPLDELDPGERPRPRPGESRRLDEAELALLVAHAAPGPYRGLVAVLAYTGCRISEALALRWGDDFDFVESELTIGGQLSRATRTTPAKRIPRKGFAPAYQALMFPALEHILVEQLAGEQAAGRGRDSDFVFCNPTTGLPLVQRNAGKAVADAGLEAGLGHVTPHTLRRSFASLAARRGVDPVQAARMTGHSLDTWTRHYASDYGKPQRDEARARMLAHGFGVADDPAVAGSDDDRGPVAPPVAPHRAPQRPAES